MVGGTIFKEYDHAVEYFRGAISVVDFGYCCCEWGGRIMGA